MIKNKKYLHENKSTVLSVLALSVLFILIFSFILFTDIIYALIFTILFTLVSSFTTYKHFAKGLIEQHKEIVLESFHSVSKIITQKTNGRALTEIEFSKQGASFRVYLLNGNNNEVNDLFEHIISIIKNKKDYFLYENVVVIGVKNKGEIEEKRKSVKEKLAKERKRT